MRRLNDIEADRDNFIKYIKKVDRSEIKNTTIEKKFTLWERIKRVMGF